jgi:hypothetical protein
MTYVHHAQGNNTLSHGAQTDLLDQFKVKMDISSLECRIPKDQWLEESMTRMAGQYYGDVDFLKLAAVFDLGAF